MTTDPKWTLTDTRLNHLRVSILESFINADGLISDAELLIVHSRNHRAASLAILGIEELGKAYFLKCIHDGNGNFLWDEDAHQRTTNHKFKQEFAFDTFNVNSCVFSKMFQDKNRLEEMQNLLEETKKNLRSKGAMDIEKQDMQFVTIHQDCSCKIPSTIPNKRCEHLVETAKIIRSLVRTLILTSSEFIRAFEVSKLAISTPLKDLMPTNNDLSAIANNSSFELRRKK